MPLTNATAGGLGYIIAAVAPSNETGAPLPAGNPTGIPVCLPGFDNIAAALACRAAGLAGGRQVATGSSSGSGSSGGGVGGGNGTGSNATYPNLSFGPGRVGNFRIVRNVACPYWATSLAYCQAELVDWAGAGDCASVTAVVCDKGEWQQAYMAAAAAQACMDRCARRVEWRRRTTVWGMAACWAGVLLTSDRACMPPCRGFAPALAPAAEPPRAGRAATWRGPTRCDGRLLHILVFRPNCCTAGLGYLLQTRVACHTQYTCWGLEPVSRLRRRPQSRCDTPVCPMFMVCADLGLLDLDIVVGWTYDGVDYELGYDHTSVRGGLYGGNNLDNRTSWERVYWPRGSTPDATVWMMHAGGAGVLGKALAQGTPWPSAWCLLRAGGGWWWLGGWVISFAPMHAASPALVCTHAPLLCCAIHSWAGGCVCIAPF